MKGKIKFTIIITLLLSILVLSIPALAPVIGDSQLPDSGNVKFSDGKITVDTNELSFNLTPYLEFSGLQFRLPSGNITINITKLPGNSWKFGYNLTNKINFSSPFLSNKTFSVLLKLENITGTIIVNSTGILAGERIEIDLGDILVDEFNLTLSSESIKVSVTFPAVGQEILIDPKISIADTVAQVVPFLIKIDNLTAVWQGSSIARTAFFNVSAKNFTRQKDVAGIGRNPIIANMTSAGINPTIFYTVGGASGIENIGIENFTEDSNTADPSMRFGNLGIARAKYLTDWEIFNGTVFVVGRIDRDDAIPTGKQDNFILARWNTTNWTIDTPQPNTTDNDALFVYAISFNDTLRLFWAASSGQVVSNINESRINSTNYSLQRERTVVNMSDYTKRNRFPAAINFSNVLFVFYSGKNTTAENHSLYVVNDSGSGYGAPTLLANLTNVGQNVWKTFPVVTNGNNLTAYFHGVNSKSPNNITLWKVSYTLAGGWTSAVRMLDVNLTSLDTSSENVAPKVITYNNTINFVYEAINSSAGTTAQIWIYNESIVSVSVTADSCTPTANQQWDLILSDNCSISGQNISITKWVINTTGNGQTNISFSNISYENKTFGQASGLGKLVLSGDGRIRVKRPGD